MTYSYRPNKSTISVIFIILSTLLNYIKATDSFPWPGRGKPVSSTFTPINPTSPAELTVIDVLSSDEQYSDLLRIIQRLKLVPAINKLSDITLYAPTNDAIREAQHAMTDNINDEARETIFYHMLNYTITSQSDQILHQTLLHPDSEHVKPKKPHSPWFPEPGDGKPLSGAGQQVRIGRANSTAICYGLPDLPVGEKYHGNCHDNGAATVLSKEPKHARNGVVYPIDKVISPPGDLGGCLHHVIILLTQMQLLRYAVIHPFPHSLHSSLHKQSLLSSNVQQMASHSFYRQMKHSKRWIRLYTHTFIIKYTQVQIFSI